MYLDSGDSNKKYAARIESVAGKWVNCRWFYEYGDLPTLKVKTSVIPHDGELFLSTHIDQNDVGSVIGPCNVCFSTDPTALDPLPADTHLCRWGYNLKRSKLVPVAELLRLETSLPEYADLWRY